MSSICALWPVGAGFFWELGHRWHRFHRSHAGDHCGAFEVSGGKRTAALSPPEIERLFATLRRLREEGKSIVFISHFIDDILRISDLVTVFRNGRLVADVAAGTRQLQPQYRRCVGCR